MHRRTTRYVTIRWLCLVGNVFSGKQAHISRATSRGPLVSSCATLSIARWFCSMAIWRVDCTVLGSKSIAGRPAGCQLGGAGRPGLLPGLVPSCCCHHCCCGCGNAAHPLHEVEADALCYQDGPCRSRYNSKFVAIFNRVSVCESNTAKAAPNATPGGQQRQHMFPGCQRCRAPPHWHAVVALPSVTAMVSDQVIPKLQAFLKAQQC